MQKLKQKCSKPGCGALKIIGKPCTDTDCPQQWVHHTDTRPAAPIEGLEIKAWNCVYPSYGHFTLKEHEAKQAIEDGATVEELVASSQAEAIIAAERAENDRLEKACFKQGQQISALQQLLAHETADNAALTARVKELEAEVEKANDLRAHEWHMRRMAQCDADLWRFSVDMGDHPSLPVKVWKQRKDLETQLAAAEKALEPFALISSEGVIKKETGHVTVTTCAEYFHEARAALEAQS
jgi:hypothetical protein